MSVYQKELYDRKVHGQPFSTGDWVWLYSPVMGKGGSHKPHCPWKGPYTVIKKFLMSHTELETTNKKR